MEFRFLLHGIFDAAFYFYIIKHIIQFNVRIFRNCHRCPIYGNGFHLCNQDAAIFIAIGKNITLLQAGKIAVCVRDGIPAIPIVRHLVDVCAVINNLCPFPINDKVCRFVFIQI